MASEVPFRQLFCRSATCGVMFFICRRCYRGQAYCSDSCRHTMRRQQRRKANRRYQQDLEIRLDHRDRQREYRKRRCQSRVTDQSSPRECGWGSITEPLAKTETESPPVKESQDAPAISWRARFSRIVCRLCGRWGQFITAFARRE
jgi:hypothetical protein